MRAAFIALVCCVAGCAATPVPQFRNTLAWSNDISGNLEGWRIEALKRFKEPFIFVCHGDSTGHQDAWWISPDDHRCRAPEDAIAQLLHDLMPDRDIVLISCNANGLNLHVARCWYCKRTVWSAPHWAVPHRPHPDSADSIWEFVEGAP